MSDVSNVKCLNAFKCDSKLIIHYNYICIQLHIKIIKKFNFNYTLNLIISIESLFLNHKLPSDKLQLQFSEKKLIFYVRKYYTKSNRKVERVKV